MKIEKSRRPIPPTVVLLLLRQRKYTAQNMSASTYDDITRVARAKIDQEIYHCSSAHYSELLQRYAESDAAASLVAREKQIRLGHVQGGLTRICVRAG